MKRRQFLITPALGALAAPGLRNGLLHGHETEPASGNPGELTDWRQHRQRLHQDFETYAPGVEYFFLGNGEVMAALQYMPDRSGERAMTFVGLTLMDPERFARKWSSFLFHPERGLEVSMATVSAAGKGYAVTPESLTTIQWTYPDGIPTVTLQWKAGALDVREELWTPSAGRFLIRRILLTNASGTPVDAGAYLRLVPSFALFDEIGVNAKEGSVEARGFASLKLFALGEKAATSGRYDLSVSGGSIPPGGSREITFIYQFQAGPPALTPQKFGDLRRTTVSYWKARTLVRTGDPLLDHLSLAARTGLRAGVGKTGKRDSGIWMYNMEWVRDDMMVLIGFLQAGFAEQARTMLVRALEHSVGEDGRTIESSRWFGYDLTEIDQNGELLFGVWNYLCWTGDLALVRKYWSKIRLVADFPLQEVFRDARTGMLRNKREFWERGGENFGVEDGFELTYQFWVILGLEKAAEMAKAVGDAPAAKRWKDAAAKIRRATFDDAATRLVENRMLIKRRRRDGSWQEYFIPANRASLPPGSPLATNEKPKADPDTSSAYPIMHGMIDPRGEIARATLEGMEVLWNQSWTHGGYSRYNTTSEPDPPAPWPLAAAYLARAFVESGMDAKAWRALRWLNDIHGGKAGAWFERMGPSITPPAPPVSVIGWVWAELTMLFVHHIAGIRPGIDRLTVRPRLIDGVPGLTASTAVRGGRVELAVRRGGGPPTAKVNGKPAEVVNGEINVPYPASGATMTIEFII
jgi:hypothetical protein